MQTGTDADRIRVIMTMTADLNLTARPSLISPGLRPEDTCKLTLNVREKHQDSLRVAAELGQKFGLISDHSIHEVMNLFVNLGLESLKRQGYR